MSQKTKLVVIEINHACDIEDPEEILRDKLQDMNDSADYPIEYRILNSVEIVKHIGYVIEKLLGRKGCEKCVKR